MIQIPKRIKVGPVTYVVDYHDGLSGDDGKSLWGNCDHTALSVAINSKIAKDFERVVVVHELLHAIYHLSGIPESEEEEKIVTSLSPLLLLLMRDNPKLLEYLCEK